MRTTTTRRKVMQNAVDLVNEDLAVDKAVSINGVIQLPIDRIKPFHDHPFRLYEGERLDDMVESIREHGILSPTIVRRSGTGYEMLAGHNRMNAARIAGLMEIPAIVKDKLTDAEAYVYVIETNMIQRSFSELLPSEKAAVLATRYEKMSCQGRRNDILEEIARLNGKEKTCGHDVHKSRSRDAIGEEYSMTGRNIARYIRVDKLAQPLKDKLDNGEITLSAAVDLSYLSDEEQKMVSEVKDLKLDPKMTKVLKDISGSLTEDRLSEIADSKSGKVRALGGMSIKISADTRQKYFSDTSAKEASVIVEQALKAWYGSKAV